MNNKEIEIKSDEIQDILSRPPHNLVRWGSFCIGFIFIILFIGSFFFCYPDTISCPIIITTPKPSVCLMSKTSGEIYKIFKRNRQHIRKNDTIAVIKNILNTPNISIQKKERNG